MGARDVNEPLVLQVIRLVFEGILSVLVLCGAGYSLMHGATDGFEAACLGAIPLVLAFWFQGTLMQKAAAIVSAAQTPAPVVSFPGLPPTPPTEGKAA